MSCVPASLTAPPGLVYVQDDGPGISRRRRGKGFAYRQPDGSALRDAQHLARIRALAIPPAYTQVWICTRPDGHLQATGRDARGRKQYRYHPAWREAQDAGKYERLLAFADALPRIRRVVQRDMGAARGPHASAPPYWRLSCACWTPRSCAWATTVMRAATARSASRRCATGMPNSRAAA
jgi:DNA topoisomerase IB